MKELQEKINKWIELEIEDVEMVGKYDLGTSIAKISLDNGFVRFYRKEKDSDFSVDREFSIFSIKEAIKDSVRFNDSDLLNRKKNYLKKDLRYYGFY